MQQGSSDRQLHDDTPLRSDRLEPYRQIVVEIMRRRGECTTEVARSTGLDRSHLGKVRRGQKPMTGNTLDALIAHLSLDRHRLSLAVEVIGSSAMYFDPAFGNLCIYFEEVVKNMLEVLREPGSLDRNAMFASLNRDFCRSLASATVRHIDDRFSKLVIAAEIRADTDNR